MVRIRDRIEWNAIDRNVLLHQEMKIFLNFLSQMRMPPSTAFQAIIFGVSCIHFFASYLVEVILRRRQGDLYIMRSPLACLYVHISIDLSIDFSIELSIDLSIDLSIELSIDLSIEVNFSLNFHSHLCRTTLSDIVSNAS